MKLTKENYKTATINDILLVTYNGISLKYSAITNITDINENGIWYSKYNVFKHNDLPNNFFISPSIWSIEESLEFTYTLLKNTTLETAEKDYPEYFI